MKLTIDFSNEIGKIKAMHAVGQPPIYGQNMTYFHYLTDAHIPYSRLHDTGGVFGKNMYVDIPNLFRDFDADENDPASYDFALTDNLLKKLCENGVKPYFRLGVTIENFSVTFHPYRIYPPKDFAKWARICEHVIRHYNEGWADGYHLEIEYWEIWNEPEGYPFYPAPMFLGTKEQYFDLYATTAKHLKKCFGDSIKVGGYASCGFYALTNENVIRALERGCTDALSNDDKRALYFKEFFEDFLTFVREENAPLDFFSYHSYSSVSNTLVWEEYVENALSAAGLLDKIEIHMNEWNTHPGVENMGTAGAAAASAAMMCGMQDTRMDMLMFYDARLGVSDYCGLFDPRWRRPFCTYDAFLAFGHLYALGEQVKVEGAGDGLYATAAKGGKEKAILLANIGEKKEISLKLEEKYYAYAVTDDTRMKQISIDPMSFEIEKETFVFLTTEEIEIPA